jgi:hypothetical protein
LRSQCGWGSPENLWVYISGESYFAHPTLGGNFTLSNIHRMSPEGGAPRRGGQPVYSGFNPLHPSRYPRA